MEEWKQIPGFGKMEYIVISAYQLAFMEKKKTYEGFIWEKA